MGHNGGPPLDDERPNLTRLHDWKRAHREAWKNPSMSVLLFRVRRAEAAGVSYHDDMLHLLDTGRHLQRADVERGAAQCSSSDICFPFRRTRKQMSEP
jgi:hypothetical protein